MIIYFSQNRRRNLSVFFLFKTLKIGNYKYEYTDYEWFYSQYHLYDVELPVVENLSHAHKRLNVVRSLN